MKQYFLDHFYPRLFKMEEFSESGIAVIVKDVLYDELRKVALIHVLVNDEHIYQNIRVVVFQHSKGGWHMNLAEGSMLMPTAGIAKALELVHQAALATNALK